MIYHTIRSVVIFFSIFLFLFLPLFADENDLNARIDPVTRRLDTIRFGLDSEIVEVMNAMEKEKDEEPAAEIITALGELFTQTRSTVIRNRILQYYGSIKNDSLRDFALQVLEDPYDEKKSTVESIFVYVRAITLRDASALLVTLLDSENETYMLQCIDTLGDVGDTAAAEFLAKYIERDLEISVKQALVRALGKLQALETWEQLTAIAENTDENAFMRMYAAEAIGAMQKPESVPVLIKLFEDSDPNLRLYVLKGLSHYTVPEAQAVILEAFRDSNYKVRLEAITSAKNQKYIESIPYILYRAKNDPEKNIKLSCFDALAVLDPQKSVSFFTEVFTDPRSSEAFKLKAAEKLIECDFDNSYTSIESEVKKFLNVANTQEKSYRNELLKLLVPIANQKLADLCIALVSSSDVVLNNFGVDIYAKNGGAFEAATPCIQRFAENASAPSLSRKAKRALGILL